MRRVVFLVPVLICFLRLDGDVLAQGVPPPSRTFNAATDPQTNPFGVRGYVQVGVQNNANLVDFAHPTDPKAPTLTTLLPGQANPVFTGLYQFHEIDTLGRVTGGLVQKPADGPINYSSAVGFATTPGENIVVPLSGYEIAPGYTAQVIYADANRISISYTTSGDAIYGYSIQLNNLNVNPEILAAYNQANQAGRANLPALPAGFSLGTASGDQLLVAFRDSGSFLDPRWTDLWGSRAAGNLTWAQVMKMLPTAPYVPPVGQGGLVNMVKQYGEETEIGCFREFEGGTVSNQGAEDPTYRRADYSTQLSMKDTVGLGWKSGVFGAYCGQTKSQPITLTEVSPFDLKNGSYCKNTPWWRGEVTMNYDNPNRNFRVPFAEEINRDWAGTLSVEYPTNNLNVLPQDHELDDLFLASGLAAGTIPQRVAMLAGWKPAGLSTGDARTEAFRRAGASRLLLPLSEQDKLRCDFATYVAAKGTLSMYAGVAVDGIPITSFALGGSPGCPPSTTARERRQPVTQELLAQDSVWRSGNGGVVGKAWSKIGLYPNERSKAVLKFEVCGDKEYNTDINDPEVFRLGLVSDELFQTLTSAPQATNFYKANQKAGLKEILDPTKSPLFGWAEPTENRDWNTVAVGGSAGATSSVLGAQTGGACFSMAASAQAVKTNPDGSIVAHVTVNLNNISGHGGHVQYFLNGQSQGTQWCWNLSNSYSPQCQHGSTFVIDGGDITLASGQSAGSSYSAKIDECGDRGNQEGVDCQLTNQGGTLVTNCNASVQFAPASSGCDAATTCCVTPTCTASCAICQRAQSGPTDTTAWATAYGANHQVVGYQWNGSGYPDNPADAVRLTYLVPGWTSGQCLPAGCHIEKCKVGDLGCLATAPRDCNGNIGYPSCAYTHDRVIDIYNSVPFLASAWDQAAGTGTKLIQKDGQGRDIYVPGGFMNIFRSYGTKGLGVAKGFGGCTSKQQMVLDPAGNFAPAPGAAKVSFTVGKTGFGNMGAQTNEISSLTQTSSTGPVNVTFYRLGGMCNADTWVQDCVLSPYSKNGNKCGRGGEEGVAGESGEGGNRYHTIPEIRKDIPQINQCQWTKPSGDNGRGFHFPLANDPNTLATNIQRAKDMGVKWLVFYPGDELQAETDAKAAQAAGIMPIIRLNTKIDVNYPQFEQIAQKLTADGIPAYVQIYNEPGDPREYKNGTLPGDATGLFANNWCAEATKVYNAGGFPGLQIMDPSELTAILQGTPCNPQSPIWNKTWFAWHGYGDGNAPDSPASAPDDTKFLAFLRWGDVFAQQLRVHLPIIGTEGGWEPKPPPGGTEADITAAEKVKIASWYAQAYNMFETGVMPNGQPLPDWMWAFSPFLLSAAGAPDNLKAFGFYDGLHDMTESINAIKALSQAPRTPAVCTPVQNQSGFGGFMR